ncbi:endonuclease domain-containing protein [Brevundimonas kwangchunensis]|uniref:Endonuclease domain-containing protein n=1 Tax=Brevundimonas kwangchunensis TaxID=322163 RepID=A0ABN1GHV9_9CAUL
MYAPKAAVAKARDLRRRLSLPEVILWTVIRGRRLGGVPFRRQHPVGPYILDFYCEASRLAVEVDGSGHEDPDRARHDARRTVWLNAQGIAVLRIPARDVLDNLEGVLATLKARAANPPPPGERDREAVEGA